MDKKPVNQQIMINKDRLRRFVGDVFGMRREDLLIPY
jgi:hypothetical protein